VLRRRHTLKKLVPGSVTRNLHEKFDTSSSQFLAPKRFPVKTGTDKTGTVETGTMDLRYKIHTDSLPIT